jgi:hypothetical protein
MRFDHTRNTSRFTLPVRQTASGSGEELGFEST